MGRFLTGLYSKARRNCDFSVNPGANSCLDGGCNGGLVCTATVSRPIRPPALVSETHISQGVPPATLAEFTLGSNGLDYYDGLRRAKCSL